MSECYICKKYLPSWFLFGSVDAWYQFNLTANAAGSVPSTMVPVHYICRPLKIDAAAPAEQYIVVAASSS